MMKQKMRYFLLLAVASLMAETALAQQVFKDLHEVKRKETIFGIARDNGITVQELLDANPEMKNPGYELKKGDIIKIMGVIAGEGHSSMSFWLRRWTLQSRSPRWITLP